MSRAGLEDNVYEILLLSLVFSFLRGYFGQPLFKDFLQLMTITSLVIYVFERLSGMTMGSIGCLAILPTPQIYDTHSEMCGGTVCYPGYNLYLLIGLSLGICASSAFFFHSNERAVFAATQLNYPFWRGDVLDGS